MEAMMTKQHTCSPVTEGSIRREMISFCIPIMIGTLFQQLYNAADVIVVGHFVGTNALAAVGGSAAGIVNMVVGFFVGISSGASVVISRHFGAGDRERLLKALQTSAAFALMGGLLLGILGMVFTPQILVLMGTPESTLADSVAYLRIYFAGLIFVFLYNIAAAALRSTGDSRRPLYYLIVTCIVNVFLDVTLVAFFHLGVAGVAIATVTAQAISAVLAVRALTQQYPGFSLYPASLRIDKRELSLLLKMGLPAGIQSIMNSISGIIMQSAVNGLGTYAVAGNAAYAKLDGIYWMVSNAFSVTLATFVGQNLGAGRKDRIRESIATCIRMDLVVTAGLSLLFCFGSGTLLYLFTDDPAVVQCGIEVMQAIAPYYVIVVFYEMMTSALRGIGVVLVPMFINILWLCGGRILWVLTASAKGAGLYGIILSCPATWLGTAVCIAVCFFIRYRRFMKEA